jgi:hypothetical protein
MYIIQRRGKTIFKVYTNQDIEHVEQYLEEKGLDYSYKNYYTTGRWGVLYNRKNTKRMHYCCKDIETLVTKYIFKEREDDA